MTDVEQRLAELQAQADEARARFTASLHELGQRVHPSTLANDAKTATRERAQRLSHHVTDAALDKPVVTGVGAAAVTGFLGWRLWRKRVRRKLHKTGKHKATAPIAPAVPEGLSAPPKAAPQPIAPGYVPPATQITPERSFENS